MLSSEPLAESTNTGGGRGSVILPCGSPSASPAAAEHTNNKGKDQRRMAPPSAIALNNAATLLQACWRRRAAMRLVAARVQLQVRRLRIAREILHSELSYQRGLRILEEHYMQQLVWKQTENLTEQVAAIQQTPERGPRTRKGIRRRARSARRGSVDSNFPTDTPRESPNTNGPFPSAEDIDKMFCDGALVCLLDLSQLLSSRLSERVGADDDGLINPASIGEIFVQQAPRFILFSEYCKKVEKAMATVIRCEHGYPAFKSFIAQLRSVPSSGGEQVMDISSYLITPVQRLPRYVLLLRELLDATEVDNFGRSELETALVIVQNAATQVDIAVGLEQRRERMEELAKEITGLDSAPPYPALDPLWPTDRQLLKEGPLQLLDRGGVQNIISAAGGTPLKPTSSKRTPSRLLTPVRSVTKRRRASQTPVGTPASDCSVHAARTPTCNSSSQFWVVLCSDVLLLLEQQDPLVSRLESFRLSLGGSTAAEDGGTKLKWVGTVPLADAEVEMLWETTLQDKCEESVDSETVERGFCLRCPAKTHADGKQLSEVSWTLVASDPVQKFDWLAEITAALQKLKSNICVAQTSDQLSTCNGNGNGSYRASLSPQDSSDVHPELMLPAVRRTPIRAMKNTLQKALRRPFSSRRRHRHSIASLVDAEDNQGAAPMCDASGCLLGDELPETDEAAEALRNAMLNQMHTMISMDMRQFLLKTAGLGTLQTWAEQSEWAHDTGGDAHERRAERGIWQELFTNVQKSIAPQFGLDASTLPRSPRNWLVGIISDTSMASEPGSDTEPVLIVSQDSEQRLPALDMELIPPKLSEEGVEELLSVRLPPLAATPLAARGASRPQRGVNRPAKGYDCSPVTQVTTAHTPSIQASGMPQVQNLCKDDKVSSPTRRDSGGRKKRRSSGLLCCAAPIE